MTDFVKRLVDVCYSEWLYFGKQTYNINYQLIRSGKKETSPGFWQRVGVYWEMGTGYENLSGLDEDWPWSAAFISYVMRIAGAKDNFMYSIRHSDFIRDAVIGGNISFVGHKTDQYSPKVGDLVCLKRQDNLDYDNLPDKFKSHSDVVVKKNSGYLEVIGGNVGDSVSKKHLKIDADGLVVDQHFDWFVVIETKL